MRILLIALSLYILGCSSSPPPEQPTPTPGHEATIQPVGTPILETTAPTPQ